MVMAWVIDEDAIGREANRIVTGRLVEGEAPGYRPGLQPRRVSTA